MKTNYYSEINLKSKRIEISYHDSIDLSKMESNDRFFLAEQWPDSSYALNCFFFNSFLLLKEEGNDLTKFRIVFDKNNIFSLGDFKLKINSNLTEAKIKRYFCINFNHWFFVNFKNYCFSFFGDDNVFCFTKLNKNIKLKRI